VSHVAALVVLAKAPLPGRSKTRLCPPCTPIEAAQLASAALADTLAVARTVPAARHVLVIEGSADAWLGYGFDVIPQRGGGLDERLAAAFEDVGGPALLIGMDTPQLTGRLLSDALYALEQPDVDAVIGPAADGGYWCIGLKRSLPAVFIGVPMSAATTGRAQRLRLRALGLRVVELPTLRDVDRFEDAVAVAAAIPGSRFAAALEAVV
jgi:rSAM/selenodomain-associated transferase 1